MRIVVRGRPPVALALTVLAALAGLAACGSSGGQPASGPSSQPAAATRSQLNADDLTWLNQAHQANMAEVDAGELAGEKGGTAALRAAGATLAHDHAVLDTQLVRLANRLNVTLVSYTTLQQDRIRDQLINETGSVFDQDFTGSMITAHQQAIAQTRTELRDGSDPAVQALARQTLPVLLKHLAMMQRVAGSG